MRKTRSIVIGLLLTTSLLVACGNSPNTNSKMQIEDVTTPTTAERNEESGKMLVKDAEDADNPGKEKTGKSNKDYQSVLLGDGFSLGFADLYLDRVSIDAEAYPKDTSGVFMYLPATEGKKYFQVIGALKNTYTSMYEIKNTVVQFIFDDKYEYSGFLKADSGLFEAYDYQVDPFETVDFHLIGEIPDELINSFSKCIVEFGFKENFEKVRNFESCDYKYRLEYTR